MRTRPAWVLLGPPGYSYHEGANPKINGMLASILDASVVSVNSNHASDARSCNSQLLGREGGVEGQSTAP